MKNEKYAKNRYEIFTPYGNSDKNSVNENEGKNFIFTFRGIEANKGYRGPLKGS